jgi:cytochrome c-type biogenesis protein CcmH/NrfG
MRGFVVAIIIALQLNAYADPKEDEALRRLDRGIAAFDAKDFATAEREFTAAHDLVPDKANPYRWLALAEIQLGDCQSAVEHIEGFLSRVPATDERVAEMTRWREFCRRQRAEQTPQPPASQNAQLTGTQGLGQPPVRSDEKPVHKRWWFWPVIGGAAVIATGAIVFAATRGDEPMLPPIQCNDAGCSR